MELRDDECSILLFNSDPEQNENAIISSKELCYFEWVPPDAPYRDQILRGVYTGFILLTTNLRSMDNSFII